MAPKAPRQYTCSAYRSVGVHGPYAAGPERPGATFRFSRARPRHRHAPHRPARRPAQLLQDDPAHPWTVASLAARAGVSRAGLARRFAELVGEPPMACLTGWRLAVAADLLRESDATVEAVARKVGYSAPFALSAAFKRVRGVSPQEYLADTPGDPLGTPGDSLGPP